MQVGLDGSRGLWRWLTPAATPSGVSGGGKSPNASHPSLSEEFIAFLLQDPQRSASMATPAPSPADTRKAAEK
jgi:hypothetical protein